MNYNQKKHIQLLKRSQDLQNQGKDLFQENQKEYFELAQYNIVVEEHFFWQDRYKIFLLMENFLTRKIDCQLFCDHVYGLRCKLINKCEKFRLELLSSSEKIKDFQPDERGKNLSGFLTGLFCECECLDDTENYLEFYDSIEIGFFNFQKALKKE